MSTNKISLSIISGVLISTSFGFVSPSEAGSIQFECSVDNNNNPTTYVQTQGGVVEIFKWKSNYFQGPYTPMQRCLEVTQRMNKFQPSYLVAGRVNNYNVICAGTNCDRSGNNVLLTLRPDQNPNQVLAEIDNTRDGAGGRSMQLSGSSGGQNTATKQSNLVKTQNGSLALNLVSYIESAPKIPKNLSGNSNSSNTTGLNEEPIIVPSNAGQKPTSSPGIKW
jgi:hypothetical protein